MNGFNRLLELYLYQYNRLFWILFTIAGGVFIFTVIWGFVSLLYLDLILGVALVVIGIHRLGEEFSFRNIRKSQDEYVRALNELLQWAEKSYDYTRAFKDRHEKRIFNLDQKRAKLEDKLEDEFRSAVKKIIEMENKLNKAVRSLDQEKTLITKLDKMAKELLKERQFVERRLLDLTQTQFRALQFLRRTGRLTNKDYRQQFKVSDKKAYNELMAMAHKGLIKRQGKGRTTHYVLAF
jgi:chromosome segregation ATPase